MRKPIKARREGGFAYREMEDIWSRPKRKFIKMVDAIIKPLHVLLKCRRFRCYVENTLGGHTGRILSLRRQGRHEVAARVALSGIEKSRDAKPPFGLDFGFDMVHAHFWTFMSLGVCDADKVRDPGLREEFITQLLAGVEPLKGYDVANSFLTAAHWRYAEGRLAEAVHFAEIASNADPTWGDPDFFLGWYCLKHNHSGALDHLVRAVTKDGRMLEQISENRLCRETPDIVAKLEERFSEPKTFH